MIKGFKKIGIIALSVCLGVLSTFPQLVFADDVQHYSFGELDSNLNPVQGDFIDNESLSTAFISSFYRSFINVCNYYYKTPISKYQFDSLLQQFTLSDGSYFITKLIDLGFKCNVYYQLVGSNEFYFHFCFQYADSVGALTAPSDSYRLIEFSAYPSFLGRSGLFNSIRINSNSNSYLFQNSYISYTTLDTSVSPTYFSTSKLYYFCFGINFDTFANLNSYFLFQELDSPCGLSSLFLGVPHFQKCICCMYPLFDLYSGDSLSLVYSVNGNDSSVRSTYFGNSFTVSIRSDLTPFWFTDFNFEPLYPSPTPIPTALPTVSPTPLPLAYDSNIDSFNDGSTLGFLDTLKPTFDSLIGNFTGISFVSQSIGYLYHYIPHFAFLFFVPLIAFLSFLIGRNKS